MRIGKLRWQVNGDFADAKFLARLAAPAGLMSPPARLIRPRTGSGTTEVAWVTLSALPDTPLIVKRYHSRNMWQQLRGLFRTPRAQRAFELAFRLQANGISTAVPVAAVDSRSPWQKSAFLITMEVRSAFRLYEFNQACQDARKRRAVIKALARLMAALHDLELSHADPSLTNFLVLRTPENAWRLVLIDLDGLRANRLLSRRGELKDLRRLSKRAVAEPHERLVFLTAYCRARQPPLVAREIARRIGPLPPVVRYDVTPSSAPLDTPAALLSDD